jgi:dihydrofolate reductase
VSTCHVYIATSLDGYIARSDGGLDWLEGWPEVGHDYGYRAFVDGVDGIVMGRGTFEAVRDFNPWPYARPVVVASRTLTMADVPLALHRQVEVHAGQPRVILAAVAQRGWQRVYLDGGRLMQAFLREGLVEDLIITRLPILLGAGRALFGEVLQDVRLLHVETTAYASGFVQSRYRVPAGRRS